MASPKALIAGKFLYPFRVQFSPNATNLNILTWLRCRLFMCGIAGFIYRSGRSVVGHEPARVLESMVTRLHHRGPDASGRWLGDDDGVALGHARLSIIDLSEAGAQPMVSANGRYVMVYNGEIYSYGSLRKQLEVSGYPFRGHADTEVLLAAIQEWGLQKTLESVHGMFALAVWDQKERALYLARDRVGKKPLYYGWNGDAFLFGSELKALEAHPCFKDAVDAGALGQFMQYGWISEPLSIYRHIRKLPQGTWLRITAEDSQDALAQSYWSAKEEMAAGRGALFNGSYDQAVDRLDDLLTTAVTERMVADVDLGAFLSGGVDSSAVVGIMQRHSSRPVKTFSIGFFDKKFDEAEYARAVAKHLGTDHHELYVSPDDCLGVVDKLSHIYDEPFADASQVPTYLLAEMASRYVKVSLSGDGGDETFAGYKHYIERSDEWRRLKHVPEQLRVIAADSLSAVGSLSWRLFGVSASASTGTKMPAWKRLGSKFQHKTRAWRATGPQSVLANHFSRLPHPGQMVSNAEEALSHMTDPSVWVDDVDSISAMRHFDYVGYMVGDILVKVDRASMAVGLEVRCPILDAGVSQFAWTLPNQYLLQERRGKRILRDVLQRYVPNELTERSKRGFGVPIASWLKGPLRDWADDLLSPDKLSSGYLDAAFIRDLWSQHQSGWRDNSRLLWTVLMFQSWLFNR
jgi:asparagine synthase (glutamine-hydrolysing)